MLRHDGRHDRKVERRRNLGGRVAEEEAGRGGRRPQNRLNGRISMFQNASAHRRHRASKNVGKSVKSVAKRRENVGADGLLGVSAEGCPGGILQNTRESLNKFGDE